MTHDLELARALQGQTLVLYGGSVMETGPAARVLAAPRHPYARGLLRAWPREGGKDLQGIPGEPQDGASGCPFANRCSQRIERCLQERPAPDAHGVACLRGGIVTVLAAHGLHKRAGGQPVLRGASLRVQSGETVAITGASGAGKSTLVRVLAGLLRPDAGTVEMPGLARDGASGPARNGQGGQGGQGGLAFVFQHAVASVDYEIGRAHV